MSDPDRVEAGPPVRLGPRVVGEPVRTGWNAPNDPQGAVTRLDDLTDVDAPPGELGVLTRAETGAPAEFRPVAFRHQQPVAVEIWLIAHDLAFVPSGVRVLGDDGRRLYPQREVHPAPGRTRLEFTRPVSGTADLS